MGFDDIEHSTLHWVEDLACEELEFVNDDEIASCVYESFCMEYEPEFDTFSFDEQCDDSLHASLLGLIFVNDAQKLKYESLSVRLTSEQKFLHVESFQQLGIYKDMQTLLGNLGLLHFVEHKCATFDRLTLEFLSSLRVEWNGTYRGEMVDISFRMFNTNHRMSLKGFNNLLHCPNHPDSFCDVPQRWKPDPV